MSKARLNVTEGELAVLAEALREALAGELLGVDSIGPTRALLERVDAKLPSAVERHPARAVAGRLIAADEFVRALAARESRYPDFELGASALNLARSSTAARKRWVALCGCLRLL